MKKHSHVKLLLAYSDQAPEYGQLHHFFESFDTVYASTYRAALRCARRQHIDVVVAAMELHNSDFFAFAHDLQKDFPGLPLILLVDKITEAQCIKVVNAGVSNVFGRPYDFSLLSTKILSLSERRAVKFARHSIEDYRMENHFTSVIQNREDAIVAFLDTVDNLMELVYPAESGKFPEFKMALYEALRNASDHGCHSENDRICVSASFYIDRMIYEIRDPGKGFNHEAIMAQLAQGPLKKFGLKMIKHYSDAISFNGKGNVISLMKMVATKGACTPVTA